ncbi:MAG: serine hydrolase domain-containing protein [Acidimicrobiales bacterium]
MKVNPDAAGFDADRLRLVDEHLLRRYVDPQKIAGCQVVVARRGQIAHHSSLGSMDLERGRPVVDDTIWRYYSMTKPITGVALLSLYERGLFQLADPIDRFLPEFRGVKVKERLDDGTSRLVDPERPISVRDAMMHMTGIGYGPRGARLDMASIGRRRDQGGDTGPGPGGLGRGATLETLMQALAGEPLRFHPGTHWLYSWSTDVCARLVEVISGQPFDDYLQTTIFDPLGMLDTGFHVQEDDVDRLAALYTRDADKRLELLDDPETSPLRRPPSLLLGGGGLVGTTHDYLRFCEMLLNGGEREGVRVLGRKTVELMTSNHLPDDGDLRSVALPGGYGEVGFAGMGFGLTVAVSKGPVANGATGSKGEFMWGGAASTAFWIDPAEDLIVIFMTQLIPSGTFDFRGQLKSLVYSSIAD